MSEVTDIDGPDIFTKERANEILCQVSDLCKALLVELPLCCCHESQSLRVTFTLKWGFTAQPGNKITEIYHA